MAGSDSLMPGLIAVFALHGELREYVDLGVSPYAALRTATVNPAEYLGESNDGGTIEVGKHTDLLLVDAKPLKDISNASKITGVLMRGSWIGAGEIHKRMQAIADAHTG